MLTKLRGKRRGVGQKLTSADEGGRGVSQTVTLADKGERGVWTRAAENGTRPWNPVGPDKTYLVGQK